MNKLKELIKSEENEKYHLSLNYIDYINNFNLDGGQISSELYNNLLSKVKNIETSFDVYKYYQNQNLFDFSEKYGTLLTGIFKSDKLNPRINVDNVLQQILINSDSTTIKKYYKYYNKLGKVEKQIIDDFKEHEILKKEITEFKQKFKLMKNNIVSNPTKSDIKNKQHEYIKGKIDTKLKNIIEKIAEEYRKSIELNYAKYYIQIIENYNDSQKTEPNPYILYMKNPDYRENILKFLDEKQDNTNKLKYVYNGTKTYELKSNYKEIIKQESKKQSDNIISDYINKMFYKLGGLLIDINKEVKNIVKSGNESEGTIIFQFTDNSQFTIKNSIVKSYSKLSTPFYRYPLTFHNIINSKGEYIKNPSELTLKKYFN